ncbi:universal stress protein [Streptomyces sp. NPDC056491]|uniref:universal stress protein n=1 Tax=Streptomyces sp. NPDC056491 TaxID=3345837 RepID=UPI00368AF669
MTGHPGRDIVVGIDPVRDWHLPLAWAADEAQRRRLPLRPVLAVPPRHDTHHVDDTPGRTALRRAGADRLEQACSWVRDRHPEVDVTGDLLGGFPAPVLGGVAEEARLIVLGCRHLSRTAEFFSAGSITVPVSAHAPPAPPPGPAFSLITGVVARAMDLPRQRRLFGWTHRRGAGP